MPAIRTFDETEVVGRAMAAFYDRGYEATSVKELEAVTGLKPGSLYHAFGSKRGLFLRSLDHYVVSVVKERVATYLESGPPIDGIRAFFESAAVYAKRHGRGCLVGNTALELRGGDAEIAAKVAAGLNAIEKGFGRSLRRGQVEGSIDSHADLTAHAVTLLSQFMGMLLLAQSGTKASKLKAIVEVALATLPRKLPPA